MWVFEPGKFAGKSEEWLLDEGYMHSQKARIEFAMANASSVPNEPALSNAVGFIAKKREFRLPLRSFATSFLCTRCNAES